MNSMEMPCNPLCSQVDFMQYFDGPAIGKEVDSMWGGAAGGSALLTPTNEGCRRSITASVNQKLEPKSR